MPSAATPTPMYCVVHCLMKTSQHHTPAVKPCGAEASASSGRSTAMARPHCLMSDLLATSEGEGSASTGEWRWRWKHSDVGGWKAGVALVSREAKEKARCRPARFSVIENPSSHSGDCAAY